MNYKIGDKVILLGDLYEYKKGDISFIINNEIGGYVINVPNRISTSPDYKPNVWVYNGRIKYYYEKPLHNLFKQITVHYPFIKKDYNIIRPFIKSNETLTDEELIICQNMWEKYNNKLLYNI